MSEKTRCLQFDRGPTFGRMGLCVSEGTRVCAANFNDGALVEHLCVGSLMFLVRRRCWTVVRARPKPAH